MQPNTNFLICFDSTIDAEDSLNLEQLAHMLSQDYDLPANKEYQEPVAGEKDSGLIIAVSLIGVGISAIGTIISALSYWKSQVPKYSVTITTGEKTITLDTIKPDKLPEMISRIERDAASSETKILITKNRR
jgi:hypothetical protein